MAVLRAVLQAVGLLVVLLLAAAVLGLAVAILTIMVMQGVEEPHRPVPAPVPPRRTVPAIPKTHRSQIAPVIPAPATIQARDMAREGRKE